MVGKQALFLVVTLCILVYITFGTTVFDTTFTDAQYQALIVMTKLYLASAIYCFVVSELAKNYSQVDKFWSLIPIAYVWYFAYASGFNDRMVLMATLVSCWGLRLTYNFARRGGFSIYFWKGEEDYRWVEVKKAIPFLSSRFTWGLFNLFFICLYQMGLIFLFSLPILAAWQGSEPLGIIDYLVGSVMLILIIIQYISDQQQYDFQTEKYRRIDNKEKLDGDYKRGFVTSGLWSYSRHPNYLGEIILWLGISIISLSSLTGWQLITLTSPIFTYVLLVYISGIRILEARGRKKWGHLDSYQEYIKSTPTLLF